MCNVHANNQFRRVRCGTAAGGDAGGYRGETMASARPAGLGRDQRRLLIDGASTSADAAPSLQRNAHVGLRESAAM